MLIYTGTHSSRHPIKHSILNEIKNIPLREWYIVEQNRKFSEYFLSRDVYGTTLNGKNVELSIVEGMCGWGACESSRLTVDGNRVQDTDAEFFSNKTSLDILYGKLEKNIGRHIGSTDSEDFGNGFFLG